MQTTIYLIRHGEVFNPDGIIYGRLPNFGLSERGRQEMEKTAGFLHELHIAQIYSSPLQRAMESAKIIQNKLHLPKIQTSDELLEILTSYQGGKFSDLDNLQSEVYLKPLSPTDETLEQIAQRMMDFIKELLTKHPNEHIVVLSHGDPIMTVKAVIKKKPLEFYSFKTDDYVQHAEVYQITADEQGNLAISNAFKPELAR